MCPMLKLFVRLGSKPEMIELSARIERLLVVASPVAPSATIAMRPET